MQKNKFHWSSTLVLISFGISIFFLILLASGLGITSLYGLFSNNGSPASEMIGAFAFGFELILLLVCAWFVLQKSMGREQADQPIIFPFQNWHSFAVISIVFISVLFGGLVAFANITWFSWLILPLLTLLVIVPPIWMFFGIGTNQLEFGPRWRFFAIFGISMTVGPIIMIVLEIVLLLGIIIGGAIFVAFTQPELFQELGTLASMLELETDETVILNLLSPYITNPTAIATGIIYIAVFVPLIEELLKPLAVWLFALKIETPAQGFSMGMLSGAAFALIESLNASADGSMSWPVIVSVRAGTSLLHMTASGLVGWGIISAFREKKYMRLFGAYFMAVLIHGIWNACAAGTGLSAIGESVGRPEWLFNIAPALICGLVVLGIGMFAVLLAFNRKLRTAPIAPVAIEIETTNNIEERVDLPK